MRAFFTLAIAISLFFTFSASSSCAQNAQVPSIQLKDLEGNTVDTGKLNNNGKPILICFWATWCSPCKKELNTYMELYEEWQEKTGVKIIAVSVDDQRSVARVSPYINSVSWDFNILLDTNKQFSQAMGVLNVPHTFLIDGQGNIVWQHNNFAEGDEEEVFEQLTKAAAK
jgi:cytochrome c biogenesis protein CcmG, thiol:disulfide interchange protein DsbE